MNYNEFFNNLAANSSRNFKIEQMELHKDDELLREVIRLALDPFTQFYIRKIPAYDSNRVKVKTELSTVVAGLSKLSNRDVTGHAGIAHLKQLLEECSVDDAEVIKRVIAKDLKCGIATSPNKVWKNLFMDYPCMLAEPCTEKLLSKIKYPAFVQKKEDGLRFNATIINGKVTYFARSGKPIELHGALDDEFLAMSGNANVVFDGELLVKRDGKILSRKEGNGIINKAIKGTISPEEANQIVAQLWDYIPLEDFQKEVWNKPYSERWALLNWAIDNAEPTKIALVENHVVNSFEEAYAIFMKYLAAGFEGIILKTFAGIWENKRSKNQLKFKNELTADLRIKSMVEGEGKYVGMLGAVECESSDGVIQVRVGSGFDDDQRKEFWEEDITGMIAEIKYNERISNKKGEQSLFLPIFTFLRRDKTVANSSKEIK